LLLRVVWDVSEVLEGSDHSLDRSSIAAGRLGLHSGDLPRQWIGVVYTPPHCNAAYKSGSNEGISMYLPQDFLRVASARMLRPVVALAASAWVAAVSGASAAGPDTARAVLKAQEIKFNYQSFNTFYSCDGIEGKVKRILLALGATKELEVEARGCADSSELISDLRRSPNAVSPRSPAVTIRVTSAVEATPEALAELEKTRTQRELTARVRGNRGTALDAEAQFDAPWKPVSLSKGGALDLEPGDCELIAALRKQVLPKLGVRIVKDNLKCSPRDVNRFQPQLEVEALALPPPPEAGSVPPPSAPSDGSEPTP
jgi:hypothetical protein